MKKLGFGGAALLGVLRYIEGDFAGAADAFGRNVSLAATFEAGIGGVDWQYMSRPEASGKVRLSHVQPCH